MLLPDESTLAGRLCALASAAELGLIVAEYQRQQRQQGQRNRCCKVPFVSNRASEGNGSFDVLTFYRLLAAESFTSRYLMTICLHCFGVFYDTRGFSPDFCSNACRQAAKRACQRARKQREPHYIRFGLWDAATERSINAQRGHAEPGVSVYDAFYDPEDGCYRLDTFKVAEYARQVKRCLPLLFDRHIFIVTGDETEPGVDGEPCLRNLRLIAPAIWRNHQIVPIPLERLLCLANALSLGSPPQKRRRPYGAGKGARLG